MRRLCLLAVIALGLAACGGSGDSKPTVKPIKIEVGVIGGTRPPYAITIAPGGAVKTAGYPPAKAYPVPHERDEVLSEMVRKAFPKFKSTRCPGTSPDQAAKFITALDRTVLVRGSCVPRFTRLWDELTNSVGIFQIGGGF